MIAEMWAVHGGLAYYRMDNWNEFYAKVGSFNVRLRRDDIPEGAVCLIRDGRWTGNMISDQGY